MVWIDCGKKQELFSLVSSSSVTEVGTEWVAVLAGASVVTSSGVIMVDFSVSVSGASDVGTVGVPRHGNVWIQCWDQ